jgi:hypothetical protein
MIAVTLSALFIEEKITQILIEGEKKLCLQ